MIYKLEERVLFDAALPVDVVEAAEPVEAQSEEVVDDSTEQLEAVSDVAVQTDAVDGDEGADIAEMLESITDYSADHSNELYIIDTNVSDYQIIIDSVPDGAQVELVLPQDRGLGSVSSILAKYDNLDAIHIISHGSDGELIFGEDRIDNDNLTQFCTEFSKWNRSLTDGGDILLYGCNIAQTEAGEQLVAEISHLTGADVAATDDITGAGGDWDLEFSTGSIEAQTLTASDYNNELADDHTSFEVTSALDTGDDATIGADYAADLADGDNDGGLSLREAIHWANQDAGTETISFNSDLTINLGSKLDIQSSIDIDGGVNNITIKGNDTFTVFDFDEGNSFNGDSFSLSHVDIVDSTTITVKRGSVHFDDVVISGTGTDDTAEDDVIYVFSTDFIFENSAIHSSNAGTLIKLRSDPGTTTIVRNSTLSAGGAKGIWAYGDSSFGVFNSTIVSTGIAVNLQNHAGNGVVQNSIFVGTFGTNSDSITDLGNNIVTDESVQIDKDVDGNVIRTHDAVFAAPPVGFSLGSFDTTTNTFDIGEGLDALDSGASDLKLFDNGSTLGLYISDGSGGYTAFAADYFYNDGVNYKSMTGELLYVNDSGSTVYGDYEANRVANDVDQLGNSRLGAADIGAREYGTNVEEDIAIDINENETLVIAAGDLPTFEEGNPMNCLGLTKICLR